MSSLTFRDGIRESHVVSKAFDVNQVEPDYVNAEEDGMGFINDIPGNYVCTYAFDHFTN